MPFAGLEPIEDAILAPRKFPFVNVTEVKVGVICPTCNQRVRRKLAPFDTYYYCSHCGRTGGQGGWILHKDAEIDKMGRKHCPECHYLMRTKAWRSR